MSDKKRKLEPLRFPEIAIFDKDGQFIPNMIAGIFDLGIGKQPTCFVVAYVDGRKYKVKVSAANERGIRVQILFRKGIIINLVVSNRDFGYKIDNNVKYSDDELAFIDNSLVPAVMDFVGLFFVMVKK